MTAHVNDFRHRVYMYMYYKKCVVMTYRFGILVPGMKPCCNVDG